MGNTIIDSLDRLEALLREQREIISNIKKILNNEQDDNFTTITHGGGSVSGRDAEASITEGNQGTMPQVVCAPERYHR